MDKLKALIRNIPDFPKQGIQFKDITPLLADAECFHEVIDALRNRHAGKGIDMVVGIEARPTFRPFSELRRYPGLDPSRDIRSLGVAVKSLEWE